MAPQRFLHLAPGGVGCVAVMHVHDRDPDGVFDILARDTALLLRRHRPAQLGLRRGQPAAHQVERGQPSGGARLPGGVPRGLCQGPGLDLRAVVLPLRRRQEGPQKRSHRVTRRPSPQERRCPRRVGELALADLRLYRVEVQRPLHGCDGQAERRERFRLCESSPPIEQERQVVQGHAVLRLLIERRTIGRFGLGRIVLDLRVVVGLGQVTLERGEPVAVAKCLRGGRGDARLGAARVAEHHGELAVRHGERRVQRDRFFEERRGAGQIDRVARPHALRVLAQRLERARGHLLERVAVADGAERLPDPLP